MARAALAPIPSGDEIAGWDYHEWLAWIDDSLERERAARRFTNALRRVPPRDRLSLLETMFDALRPGMPIAFFESLMAEAYFWADLASRSERKAYALACVSRMSPEDRASFIAYLTGGRDA